MAELIVVLHDVSSAQRLIDTARLVYGLNAGYFLVTKAYGSAASSGVPEVNRLALRLGKGFAVLSSLRDAVELLSPKTVFVVSYEYGEPMEPAEIAEELRKAEKPAMIVLGGIDAAPGKDAVSIGKPVYIRGASTRLGPVAEAALILYSYARAM